MEWEYKFACKGFEIKTTSTFTRNNKIKIQTIKITLKLPIVTEHGKYVSKVFAEKNDPAFKIRLISQKLSTSMNLDGLTYGVCF